MLTRNVAHGHVPGCRGRASASAGAGERPDGAAGDDRRCVSHGAQATAVEVSRSWVQWGSLRRPGSLEPHPRPSTRLRATPRRPRHRSGSCSSRTTTATRCSSRSCSPSAARTMELVRAQTLADARREKLDADRLRPARPRPARRARAGGAAQAQDRPRGHVGARADRASTTSGAASRRSPRARRTTWSRARSTGRAWRAPCATRSSAGAPTRRASSSRSRALHAGGERPPRARPAAGAAGHATPSCC